VTPRKLHHETFLIQTLFLDLELRKVVEGPRRTLKVLTFLVKTSH